MHPLLEQQMHELGLFDAARVPSPEQWSRLIRRVSQTYQRLALHQDGDGRAGHEVAVAPHAGADEQVTEAVQLPSESVSGLVETVDQLLQTEATPEQQPCLERLKRSRELLARLVHPGDHPEDGAGGRATDRLEQNGVEFDIRQLVHEAVTTMARHLDVEGVKLTSWFDWRVPRAALGDRVALRQALATLLDCVTRDGASGDVGVEVRLEHASDEALVLSFRLLPQGAPRDLLERLAQALSPPAPGAEVPEAWAHPDTGRQALARIGAVLAVDPDPALRLSVKLLPEPPGMRPVLLKRRNLRGLSVLVAGGDDASRHGLTELLARAGASGYEVTTAADALEQARSAIDHGRPYDLIVIDLPLPDADGFALAAELRELVANDRTRLVCLTPERHRDLTAEAREAGLAGLLPKPVQAADLQDMLAVVTGLPVETAQTRAGHPGDALVTAQSLADLRAGARPRGLLVMRTVPSRLTAARSLHALGCWPDVVDDPREAARAIAEGRHGVAIVDATEPTSDAARVVSELHAAPEAAQVPVIAITSERAAAEQQALLQAGAVDTLSGALDPKKLQTVAREWMQEAVRAGRRGERAPVEPVLDASKLAEFREFEATGADSFLAEIFEAFLQDAPERVEVIHNGVKARVADEVAAAAHSLKGSCLEVGALEMAVLAYQLERQGRAGDLDGAAELAGELEAALDRVRAALREMPELAS